MLEAISRIASSFFIFHLGVVRAVDDIFVNLSHMRKRALVDITGNVLDVNRYVAEWNATTALLHGSGQSPVSPFPERESPNSVAVGHPEMGHRVENPACELDLDTLARQGATPHTSADDRLKSIDRILDHAALAKARPLVPLAST